MSTERAALSFVISVALARRGSAGTARTVHKQGVFPAIRARARLAGIAVAFLCCAPLAAQAVQVGTLAYQNGVSVLKTQWFDIIYPPASADAAAALAEHADALYRKACAFFCAEPEARMPVVIAPASDIANAYYNPLPYSHIVIYDTVPDAASAHAADYLCSTFLHELVHAVSLNFKSPAFKTLSRIAGDELSPALLNMPLSWIEGVAVLAESADGEGRLNDGFSLHTVRQAKLEGKFPAWDDATGLRDTAPAGRMPYLFGGAFAAWVRETYGQELFAEFWKQSCTLQAFRLSPGIFEKTFGADVRDAWRQFMQTVPEPALSAEPQTARQIDAKRGLFSSLTSFAGGFAWLDDNSGAVYFCAGAESKPHKLLEMYGLKRISFSRDGAFLALSRNARSGGWKSEAYIYNCFTRERIKVPADSVRDATVATLRDGARYACAVHTASQTASLACYPFDGARVAKDAAYVLEFPRNAVPFSPVDSGDGRLACVYKNGAAWSLALFDPMSGETRLFAVPEAGMTCHSLSAGVSEGGALRLYFSWATRSTFPRAGFLEIEPDGNAAWHLAQADVSGGVYAPSPLPSETLAYASAFFGEGGIFVQRVSGEPFKALPAESRSKAFFGAAEPEPARPPVPASAPYEPLRYWKRVALIPFPLVTRYDENLRERGLTFLGVSAGTTDPGEQLVLYGAGSFDPFRNEETVGVAWLGGNSSLLFDAALAASFNKGRFAQNTVRHAVSSALPLGANGSVQFLNDTRWFYGEGSKSDDSAEWGHAARNILQASVSTVRQSGLDYHEVKGLSFAPFLDLFYSGFAPKTYQNVGAHVTIYAPYLLTRATLFPAHDEFLRGYARATLFSTEIQKGIPYVTLFVRRVSVLLAYKRLYKRENDSWDILKPGDCFGSLGAAPVTETLTLSAVPSLGINTGAFTYAAFDICFDFVLHIHPKSPLLKDFFRVTGKISL